MGIKLRKKESMEHCDSCGATMSEYEYDRYGGLCKLCRGEESKSHGADGKASGIQGNEASNKRYIFTWWDNEPTSDRRPTTKADLKNCLHKEIFLAADDAEALKLAVGYLCDYIGEDPENIRDTPEEIWDFFNKDWGYGDPIPMVLKQGGRTVKDSGFYPDDVDDDTGLESKANEGSFTDNFRIQYLDEFDPEFSGKEVMIKGTGTDRRSARKDAINKFYDGHPDAEIYAIK